MNKLKSVNFIKYKDVGWSLQLWRLKIRYNKQQAYKGIYFEWGKFFII